MEEKKKIGYWRMILLQLLGLYNSIVAINHALPTFQSYTPKYFCQVDNLNTSVEGCVKELNTSVQTNEPSCPQGYQFESERGDWTIITEWQLICEHNALRPLTTTLYFCGVTLGAIICGILADRYGRRPLVLICLYMQGLLGVSLYFCSSLEAFVGIRFVQGFFVQGLQTVTFTLMMELVPTRSRIAARIIFGFYWPFGLMYLAVASYCIPNWRTLQLVLSIPTAVTLLYVCLIPESARWLATRGRHREAQKVWDKILPCTNNKFSREMELVTKKFISDEVKCTGSSVNSKTQNKIEIKKSVNNIKLHCNINTCEIDKNIAEETKLLVVNDFESKKDIEEKEHQNISPEETASKNIGDETNTTSNSSQISTRECGIRESFQRSAHINNCSGNSNNADSQNDIEVQIGNLVIEPLLVSNENSLESLSDIREEEENNFYESTLVNVTNKCGGEKSNESKKVIYTNGSNLSIPSVKVSDDNNEVKVFNSRSTSCNGSVFDKNNEIEIADNPSSEKIKTRRGILELFRNRILCKYNLIMLYVWFNVSLSYFGIMFYIPDLLGERHLNFLLGAILETVSYIITYFILSRFGCRRPLVGSLLICGIICLVVGTASIVHEEGAGWIGYTQTALALVGKAVDTGSFVFMFLYTSELFPTILRAAAVGHCGFWARVGSFLAPQLLFLGEYTLPVVPLAVMGILGMSAGLLVIALPETFQKQLPDTVEEAELLVKNK